MATFEEMYKDFVFTREGILIDVSETSFITYKFEAETSVFAIDLYTIPEKRNSKHTLQFYHDFEQKMKQKGIKQIITCVAFFDQNSTTMLSHMMKSGYKLHSSDGTVLYVRKEL